MCAGMVIGMMGGAQAASTTSITIPEGQAPNTINTLDNSMWAEQLFVDQGVVMEGLYGYSPDGKIVPKIATGYTVSKGGTVWTFHLRHDAKWSNGKPVTAHDFYYSWMRIADPKNSTDAVWASVMTNVVNAWTYHAGGCAASAVGLKVINNYTLQVTLTAPHNIIGELVMSGAMPLYGPSVNAHPTNWYMPGNFVSDAPYTVKSFVPNGNITLVRNPNYVGAKGETNVGNVQEINIVPGSTVPVEDYMSKKVDAAVIGSASDYQYASTHSNLKSQIHTAVDNQIQYLEWDKSTEASPLDNLKVRQAVSMAIDRQPIVSAVMKNMVGATNIFGLPGWETDKAQNPLPYDVKKAQALLAQAGYPGGKGVPKLYIYTQTQTDNPNSVPVAEALQQELKESLGIDTVITPLANTQYGNVVWGGINAGIHPGYVIGGGTPNNFDVTSLPLGSQQELFFVGDVGPLKLRQSVSAWYYDKYDPADVAKFGSPDTTSAGTKWTDWTPLIAQANQDIAYFNKWNAQQEKADPLYKLYLSPPGAATNEQQLQTYIQAYRTAKTAADKHTAWVAFWEWVCDYSKGNGATNFGLNGQVYFYQNAPKDVLQATKWQRELGVVSNEKVADKLAVNIDNYMMQQGYGIPLYYFQTIYLESSNLSGLQANPWSWGGLYQWQYATVK